MESIDRLSRGSGVTRRSLLRGMVATGFVSSLGLPIMAASAQGVARGGTLTANIKDLPNFDILGNTTSWVILALGPCYSGLVAADPADPQNVLPELAERWETSEDGTAITFHLRDGVTFHDGVAFTSADVKYTFDTARNPPEGTVSVRRSAFANVTDIEAPDPRTVIFRLRRPQQSFIPLLATGWMVVLPKHILERDGNMKETVVGTGQYKLLDYQRGVSLTLEKNPDYFAAEPNLDTIVNYVVADSGTVDAYFRTGQLLLCNEMSTEAGIRLESEGNADLTVQRSLFLDPMMMTINTRRAPMDDIRVRQAISYALDRYEMLSVLLRGQGQVGGFVPPGPFALAPEALEQTIGYGRDRAANLEKSKALLAEAGLGDGFSLTLLSRNVDAHQSLALLAQSQLAQVGINVVLDLQETATFYDAVLQKNYDMTTHTNSKYPVNDLDAVFSDHLTSGPNNLSGLFDPRIDELNQQQTVERDSGKRIAIGHEMDRLAIEGCSGIVCFYKNKFVGLAGSVQGYRITGNPDDASRLLTVSLKA